MVLDDVAKLTLEDVKNLINLWPSKAKGRQQKTKRRKMKGTISRIRSITIVALIVIIHQSAILIYIYIL